MKQLFQLFWDLIVWDLTLTICSGFAFLFYIRGLVQTERVPNLSDWMPSEMMIWIIGLFLAGWILRGICQGSSSRLIYAAYLAIVFLLLGILHHVLEDDPPLEWDFSEADLQSVSPSTSFGPTTLYMFSENSDLTLSRDWNDLKEMIVLTNIGDCAESIVQAWEEMASVRQVFNVLNQSDAISDRIDDGNSSLESFQISFESMRAIAFMYSGYCRYQALAGNFDEAVCELTRIHGVVRKTLPEATVLANKMIWVAVAGLNVETANVIIKQSNCPPSQLARLAQLFTPMTDDEVSMHKPVIHAYLSSVDAYTQSAGSFSWPGAFLPHATQRRLYTHTRQLITCLKISPPDVSMALTEMNVYLARVPLRNSLGWKLIKTFSTDYSAAIDMTTRNRTMSDLFFLELSRRLGASTSLTDVNTGRPYHYDPKKDGYVGTGKDGALGTEDDVYLEQICGREN